MNEHKLFDLYIRLVLTNQNGDTYYYILQYQCNDNGNINLKIEKGSIHLIR